MSNLNANAIAFIGLCREYCVEIENAREAETDGFVSSMLKLLPRLYISAFDLTVGEDDDFTDGYVENLLEEDYYESLRRNVATLLGENDTYLEVFEQEMKYSDTPVAASISEGLADIFQPLYNFMNTIREDATDETVSIAIKGVKEEFDTYWSATLCNVMRALNRIRMEQL